MGALEEAHLAAAATACGCDGNEEDLVVLGGGVEEEGDAMEAVMRAAGGPWRGRPPRGSVQDAKACRQGLPRQHPRNVSANPPPPPVCPETQRPFFSSSALSRRLLHPPHQIWNEISKMPQHREINKTCITDLGGGVGFFIKRVALP